MAETLLVLVILAALAWWGLRAVRKVANRMATLSMSGARAKGHVRRVEKKRLSRTDNAYLVHIEFETTLGKQHTYTLKVRHSDVDDYYEGQVLDIVYDPSNPDNCALRSTLDEVQSLRSGSRH